MIKDITISLERFQCLTAVRAHKRGSKIDFAQCTAFIIWIF